MSEVTDLLANYRQGDAAALDRLLPLVYHELQRMARNHLRRERPEHTLEPTALVHEAYLRLVEQRDSDWENRAHFLAIAAQAMRRSLLDYARRRHAQRRGGHQPKISLDEALVMSEDKSAELIALDAALDRLAEVDPQQARIVELHFFGGLTLKEIAGIQKSDESTVRQEWRMAKAWLHRTLA